MAAIISSRPDSVDDIFMARPPERGGTLPLSGGGVLYGSKPDQPF
jgi:hypothetical protein